MRFNKLVAMAFLVPFLSGCGAMVSGMVGGQFKNSKYLPTTTTENEINEYFDLLEKVDRKVVSDELGQYFHKKEKDGVFSQFTLLKEDGAFLKLALSSAIGLMEPVYSYDANGDRNLDWGETKRIYNLFTKEIGLNILPLKYTKEYHNKLMARSQPGFFVGKEKKPLTILSTITGSVKTLSTALSGNMQLYSSSYYSDFLSKITKDATYLISFPDTGLAEVKTNGDRGVSYYNNLARRLEGFLWARFKIIPVDYFKNLKKPGFYRPYSGCLVISKKVMIERINVNNETTSIPYYSGIKHAIKDKNENEKSLAKKRLIKALSQVAEKRKLVENTCKSGFKKMSLSGAIESRKLR